MMEGSLVYVNKAVVNSDGSCEYDFYFSDTPDVVWGIDWDIDNPASTFDLSSNNAPDSSTYQTVKRITFPLQLKTIQETTCYSMEYAIYGIVALAWINLDGLEEYPENGRCVFHFGDSFEKVKSLLSEYNVVI